MELSDKIYDIEEKRQRLVQGNVYSIVLNDHRYEGTFAGIEHGKIVLRTGKMYGKRGETLFDKKEFASDLVNYFYPL